VTRCLHMAPRWDDLYISQRYFHFAVLDLLHDIRLEHYLLAQLGIAPCWLIMNSEGFHPLHMCIKLSSSAFGLCCSFSVAVCRYACMNWHWHFPPGMWARKMHSGLSLLAGVEVLRPVNVVGMRVRLEVDVPRSPMMLARLQYSFESCYNDSPEQLCCLLRTL